VVRLSNQNPNWGTVSELCVNTKSISQADRMPGIRADDIVLIVGPFTADKHVQNLSRVRCNHVVTYFLTPEVSVTRACSPHTRLQPAHTLAAHAHAHACSPHTHAHTHTHTYTHTHTCRSTTRHAQPSTR